MREGDATYEEGYRGMHDGPIPSSEIDRRINHSETRIKNWVIAGVATNLIGIMLFSVPLVYYLGGIQEKIAVATSSIAAANDPTRVAAVDDWRHRREIWEAKVEAWMITQGYNPVTRGP